MSEEAVVEDLAGLLARAAQGDAEAFGRFYDATCRQAYGLALARSRRRDAGAGAHRAAAREMRHRYLLAWRFAALQSSSGLSPLAWLLALDEPAPLPVRVRPAVACA